METMGAHFDWFPKSFIIYPKEDIRDKGGSLSIRDKIKLMQSQSRQQKDTRKSFIEYCSHIEESQSQPLVWIAKSSNGAQGINLRTNVLKLFL